MRKLFILCFIHSQSISLSKAKFATSDMCGIAGIISNNSNLVHSSNLQAMIEALQHRGPNGWAVWNNAAATVGLAHARLSVIDLSHAAAQPMHKLGLSIVFNGEIYNYIELRAMLLQKGYEFSTQSDTEVLLCMYHCYKEACLNYLDGMFAFAIWDEQAQMLFIARDRFGEKPLYYHFDAGDFYFASEMKAFWAVHIAQSINHSMLLNYLTVGFTSHPADATATFFKGIHKLPAAHFLVYDFKNQTSVRTRYWQLDKTVQQQGSAKAVAEQLQALLQQSVARRLRSDVAVGTSLSGGLDSSSIVAMVASQTPKSLQPVSFSAVWPGFDKDESAYVQQVVQQYGLKNYTISPSAADFAQSLQKLLYHQEEPVQSSSIFAQYAVYALAKEKGITVMLDGQGADEVVAGYHKYYPWFWQQLLKQPARLLKELQAAQQHGVEVGFRPTHVLAGLFPKMAAQQLSKKVQGQMLGQAFIHPDYAQAYFDVSATAKPTVHALNDILYYNTCVVGLEDLLRYADRNSMAHGIEVRLPFLYHELVSFVFSLAAEHKMHDGYTKYILRLAIESYLPKNIVWRVQKIGFEPPQKQWLSAPSIQPLIEEAKLKLIQHGIFNKAITNTSLPIASAHAANNMAWYALCAGFLPL